MAFDLNTFSTEPVQFDVEHEGETLKFFVDADKASVKEFSKAFKGASGDMRGNMRRSFLKLLLDEDQKPLTPEWVDTLLDRPGLMPLAIKINDGLNTALGLNDLASKKA